MSPYQHFVLPLTYNHKQNDIDTELYNANKKAWLISHQQTRKRLSTDNLQYMYNFINPETE